MLECIYMRTTVQLRDDQREALARLASRRGLRGYSTLIQEAVDAYLDEDKEAEDRESFLALQGSITDEQAERMIEAIKYSREHWRVP